MESLAQRTAARLVSDLPRYKGRLLPTVREMCGIYDVSLRTMHEAVQIVKEQGLIDTRRGRRLRKPGDDTGDRPQPQSSSDRILDVLRGRILNGTYRQGAGFPKVAALTVEFGVSPRTVKDAVARLEAESLLHGHGRGWRIGHPDAVGHRVSVTSPPVVILLTAKESSWLHLKQGGRERKFSLAFEREADLAGVEIVPAFMTPGPRLEGIFSIGTDQIRRLVTSLGSRYRGTMVVARPGEFAGFYDLLGELSRREQTVVWLDRHNEVDRNLVKPGRFVRATHAPEKIYAMCLEFLYQLGHRRIVMPLFFHREGPWGNDAGEVLAKVAERFGGVSWEAPVSPFESGHWREEIANVRARVRRHLLTEGNGGLWRRLDIDPRSFPRGVLRNFFKFRGPADVHALNLFQESKGVTSRDGLGAAIARTAALFGLLMIDSKVRLGSTAIIAPTEFDAYHYYLWLRVSGIPVPREFSLIAAENLFMQVPYPLPITTVDFGYDWLGHDAFHTILGDRPVLRREGDQLLAQPHVVRRGSVADLRR